MAEHSLPTKNPNSIFVTGWPDTLYHLNVLAGGGVPRGVNSWTRLASCKNPENFLETALTSKCLNVDTSEEWRGQAGFWSLKDHEVSWSYKQFL